MIIRIIKLILVILVIIILITLNNNFLPKRREITDLSIVRVIRIRR